jgi:hypothetical protein
MEEAPENGKESSHSAHANRIEWHRIEYAHNNQPIKCKPRITEIWLCTKKFSVLRSYKLLAMETTNHANWGTSSQPCNTGNERVA